MMDKECVAFCAAVNMLPGICTVESCCGHGERPFHVWFEAESLGALPKICYWLDE